MSESYDIPVDAVETCLEINKSRFLTWAGPVESREQALAQVALARERHPDARHHCYAYLIGPPASARAAMHDAGEPAGTAGRPIFNVIEYQHLTQVLVVVSRYFGGIKLGAGGLVRAYSAAARQALEQIERRPFETRAHFTLVLDFSHEARLRHWASLNRAIIDNVRYAQRITLDLSLPEGKRQALVSWCAAEQIELQ